MAGEKAQASRIAAINVGASGMRVAVVDILEGGKSYKIVAQQHIPGKQPNEESIFASLGEAFGRVMASSGTDFSALGGFAVTSPGPIDRKRRQVLNTPNMNWSYVDVEPKLYRAIHKPPALSMPLYLERDAIGITLAEQYFGLGHDLSNFAALYIGTGLGAGFVLGGKVFHGVHDHAGEFGHSIIDIHSKDRCRCDNFGCLEFFASGSSLVRHCEFDIKRGKPSVLQSRIREISYNDVLQAAEEGDAVALDAFKPMSIALGIGISNLVNTLDLEKIIISGPLSRSKDYFLDNVRTVASKNIMMIDGVEEWCRDNIVVTGLRESDIEIAGAVAGYIAQRPPQG